MRLRQPTVGCEDARGVPALRNDVIEAFNSDAAAFEGLYTVPRVPHTVLRLINLMISCIVSSSTLHFCQVVRI